MRQPVLVIAALAVAAALTACGGGSGGALSLDPVAQAAEKTMHSSGEKISITGDFDVSGRSLHMFGGGVSNSSSADLTVVVDAFSQNHLTLREIYVTEAGNPVVYLSSPQFKGQIPHGKKWARIDIGKALKQRYGMNVGQMPGANQNPTQFVQLLRTSGLEPKKVGEETIDGTPATHYHVVIDAEKAAKASGASAAGIRALRGQAGSTTFPMDVWVDKSGYLRRERMTFEEQGAKATMTMTMTDFGRAVSIKPPPKGETVDMTKVAASGGG